MTSKLQHPLISYSLVTGQFALIALLLLQHPLQLFWSALPMQIMAAIVGLWAVRTMHLGQFNIVPDPKSNTHLVDNGPYGLIRHPMYLSILLFFLPGLWTIASLEYTLSFVALFAVLFNKLLYEEHLLKTKIDGYASYMKSTKRLLPWLF